MGNGKGVLKCEKGRIYEGDFQYGKFHGQGTVIYENYSMYEGSWENDRKYGKGTMNYNTGDVFEESSKIGRGTVLVVLSSMQMVTYIRDWKIGFMSKMVDRYCRQYLTIYYI
jgi:hypothetical protein